MEGVQPTNERDLSGRAGMIDLEDRETRSIEGEGDAGRKVHGGSRPNRARSQLKPFSPEACGGGAPFGAFGNSTVIDVPRKTA
jgi:hypothetical protein